MKELEASLRMGIYEDRQIHTKTGFRPIKLQESRSGPHTNRTLSNNNNLLAKLVTLCDTNLNKLLNHIFWYFVVFELFFYQIDFKKKDNGLVV